MKAMFVGGRLHAQLVEVPRGNTEYTTSVCSLDGDRVMVLKYLALKHPQLFELAFVNDQPIVQLPLDFYFNKRIRMWLENIAKYTRSALREPTTTKKSES